MGLSGADLEHARMLARLGLVAAAASGVDGARLEQMLDSYEIDNPGGGGGGIDEVTIDVLPAGSCLFVTKSGGSWPARPTDRSDIMVIWKGPDPSPAIVASGTGGMLDNVDMRFVTS